MDLGFSRRDRSRDPRGADPDRLRSLLAEIAMRQSMTATARLQAGDENTIKARNAGAAIGHFAPAATLMKPAAAFHPQVAAAIVNERQDS